MIFLCESLGKSRNFLKVMDKSAPRFVAAPHGVARTAVDPKGRYAAPSDVVFVVTSLSSPAREKASEVSALLWCSMFRTR